MQIIQPCKVPSLSIPTWAIAHLILANLALTLPTVLIVGQPKGVRVGWLQTVLTTTERPLTLAILDFGDSAIARLAADKLAANLKHETSVMVFDRDQVRAAARGAGYTGSMSLSLSEARNLGAALGSDFF